MAEMIDLVQAKSGNVMRPIFITCDPARDTPAVIKSYLKEFHPTLIGLTGTWEQIKAVCKAYRVYFSTPPGLKPGQDYLVDHSIYFYLMGESSK
jgi:protein SCO1